MIPSSQYYLLVLVSVGVLINVFCPITGLLLYMPSAGVFPDRSGQYVRIIAATMETIKDNKGHGGSMALMPTA